MDLTIAISPGELFDRLTILRIKDERITDPAKLENVRRELELVASLAMSLTLDRACRSAVEALHEVNAKLWDVEDALREAERANDFGPTFVGLARSVYRLNDERASLKKRINRSLGSSLVEEKSYASY
ncbi:MAG: hypothetical protein JST00_27910 [Deltaproteobacteria bacterium]|nr:hypothetical protein [Deltaproteobacteria bacterium]